MKRLKVLIIAIVAVILAVVIGFGAFIFYCLFGVEKKSTQDISYYRALSGESAGEYVLPLMGEKGYVHCEYDLPYLTELEPYAKYRFDYTASRYSVFESHAYILIVSYTDSEYMTQKSSVQSKYICYSGKIPGEEKPVESVYELSGFNFIAVDGGYYPKEMFLVGTSDERKEIAYIFFYDFDLDYISPDLATFIQSETGWKDILDS